MIQVLREHGTDYLFAGLLEKALKDYKVDAVITVEPCKHPDNFYFSQDYFIPPQDVPSKFVFYVLPSLRKDYLRLMGENCALVSYAADVEVHKPRNVEKKYDVGFIGRPYYHSRELALADVEKHYPRSFFNSYETHGLEMAERLSECKVLLNHTRPEIDINHRFFEAMALGAQVMLRTPSLNEFATEGVHYLGYSTNEEMLSQIEKLLKDDELRLAITRNARSHVLSNHTYAHRAQSVVSHIKDYYERTA